MRLEPLVEASLDLVRDLYRNLDLYECHVARLKDYRSCVLEMIRSVEYLDKMDRDENEILESDEEEDDYEEELEEEEEDDDEDSGSVEVDGDDIHNESDVHLANGNGVSDGAVILNGDEDESEAEEETDNGASEVANGFRIVPARPEEVDIDESDDEENLGEEIDEEEAEEEEDVVEVHDVSDDEDDEADLEDEDVDDDVDDDEDDGVETDDEVEGEEIDGHERGEEEDDEDGELGEEENGEAMMLHQGFEELEDGGAYDEENAYDDDEV